MLLNFILPFVELHYVFNLWGPGPGECSRCRATRYWLNGQEFEARWGKDIFFSPYTFRRALRPAQPPLQWAQGLLPGSKSTGMWRWPPTPNENHGSTRPLLPFCAFTVCYGATFTILLIKERLVDILKGQRRESDESWGFCGREYVHIYPLVCASCSVVGGYQHFRGSCSVRF